jgi:hypothetical protein
MRSIRRLREKVLYLGCAESENTRPGKENSKQHDEIRNKGWDWVLKERG